VPRVHREGLMGADHYRYRDDAPDIRHVVLRRPHAARHAANCQRSGGMSVVGPGQLSLVSCCRAAPGRRRVA